MKPNALDMLKLDPDAFWLEVRKVYCEKPWAHYFLNRHDGTYGCSRCHKTHTIAELYPDGRHMSQERIAPCTVPPPLTEAPEVVARKLKDKASRSMVRWAIRECGFTQDSTNDSAVHAWDSWYAYDATPCEQIACCLVALGLWQIKETP